MAPVRVLQVVAQMNRGGVETWLMQVLRNLSPALVQMDFSLMRDEPGHYDAEITSLGAALLHCPSPANPARFAVRFLSLLKKRRYDVIHSHLHHFSGFVLALARCAGVPIRIAHSHLDTLSLDAAARRPRRLYLAAMAAGVQRCATHGLAVSEPAAEALFGPRWRQDKRWEIGRCGLDFEAFRRSDDASSVRAEFGVSPDSVVLGHVGRFDPQKNHLLLVKIAASVFRREPRARLVLVGDGPLRGSVEREATRLGIQQRIVFAGIRSDIPRVLRSFDVFVLPSLREGLPLVGLEAQAAGVPIVLSDGITRELAVIPELFTWRSTADPPDQWAEAVLSAARGRSSSRDTIPVLEKSAFSLQRSLSSLLAVYGSSQ
jgi:glycosyltransferase involved in cell wall biosynthesis